jgi:hypothetical protein
MERNEECGVYMELCAALMTMMGQRTLFIPQSAMPTQPFVIFHTPGIGADGVEVRLRYDGEPFEVFHSKGTP